MLLMLLATLIKDFDSDKFTKDLNSSTLTEDNLLMIFLSTVWIILFSVLLKSITFLERLTKFLMFSTVELETLVISKLLFLE